MRKLLSFVLAIAMVLTMMPFGAFSITASAADPVSKELTSISVDTLPYKTTYVKSYDKLNLDGGELTLHYSDSTKSYIDLDDSEVYVTGFNNTTVGKNTLTVTYKGFSCNFDVEIVEKSVNWFRVDSPNITSYIVNEDELDLTGCEMDVYYNDGSCEMVAVTEDMVSGYNKSKIGEQKITVTYAGKTNYFYVNVGNVTLIYTPEDLDNIRNNLDANYRLANDIVFSNEDFLPGGDFYRGGEKWLPIGSEGDGFKGVFDGNGYKIVNLQINAKSGYVGLFSVTGHGSVIKNLGLVDGEMVLDSETDGDLSSLVGTNCGVIKNCYSNCTCKNSASKDSNNNWIRTGGLCCCNLGIIDNCYYSGEINTNINVSFEYVGGIAANNEEVITNSYFNGIITINGSPSFVYVGGIVEENYDVISACYSNGTISVNGDPSFIYAGGIASENKCKITDCFNASNIFCNSEGYNYYCGGICAKKYESAELSNCYNIGLARGARYSGGICTENFKTLENCYSIIDFSASDNIVDSGYYASCTLDEMKDASTFAGFDFENTWVMNTKGAYKFPILKSLKFVDKAENMTEFMGGNGTIYNPYIISTKAQLYNVRKYPNACFKLVKDITFNDSDFAKSGAYYNGGEGWKPIGDSTTPFTGYFDGNGYSIKNLYINDKTNSFVGLFGYSNGRISNLGICDAKISSEHKSGKAYIGTICGYSNGVIEKCFLNNADFNVKDSDYYCYTGGLVGSSGSTISGCYTLGQITTNTEFGGICCNGINIANCYNKADIIATEANVAGICYSSDGEIKYCYNSGNITSLTLVKDDWSHERYYYSYVSGICDEVAGSLHDCYNSGTLISGGYSCGIAYYASLYTDDDFYNCYNIGKCTIVSKHEEYNSKTGKYELFTREEEGYAILYNTSNNKARFDNLYYLNNMSTGCYNLYYGLEPPIQLSSAQMQDKKSFEGFDFDNVWYIDYCQNKYPVLRGTGVNEVVSVEPVGDIQLFTTQGLDPKAGKQKVKLTYENGSEYTVDIDARFLMDFDNLVAGEKDYHLKVGDAVSTKTVTVFVGERTLKSIAVSTPPKTDYVQKQPIDVTGGKLTLSYDNGTKEIIDITKDMISGNTNTVGNGKKVSVSYGGCTTSYSINVSKRTIIGYQLLDPANVIYLVGEAFNYDDGGIKVIYESSDSYYELVKFTDDMISGFDSSSAGYITVNVSYKTLDEEMVLRIIEENISDVEISTTPKTSYYLNEPLDVTGGKLTVTYDTGTTRVIDLDKSMVSGFDSSVTNNSLTLTINYLGETTTYKVSVTEPKALSGVATIDGDLEYSDNAAVNVSSLNGTGEYSYQWYYDDFSPANKIAGATSRAYFIGSEADIGHKLCCEISNSRETGTVKSKCSATIGKLTGASAPKGLESTALSSEVSSDGTISGLNETMEYKNSVDTQWTSVSSPTLSNLPAGTYLVRYKETPTAAPSNFITIVISAVKFISDTSDYVRVAGTDRFDTAIQVADANKKALGVEKFQYIIVANGVNFPDALSASYLSTAVGAPILLTNTAGKDAVANYVKNNLATGGKVFVVGGEASVSKDFLEKLNTAAENRGGTAQRVAGVDRFATNDAVLKLAKDLGVSTPSTVFICSGAGYADALSAASVGSPIVLVSGSGLKDYQISYLQGSGFTKAYVIGGEASVKEATKNVVKGIIPDTVRIAGADRYATSVAVANEFFGTETDTKCVVVAYAKNFPDALSGGLLANALSAPLILASDSAAGSSNAIAYANAFDGKLQNAVALGGDGFVTDKLINSIMGTSGEIVEKLK